MLIAADGMSNVRLSEMVTQVLSDTTLGTRERNAMACRLLAKLATKIAQENSSLQKQS